MIRVFDRPAGEDLLPFSAFLWQHDVPHKITEESGRQVLWLQYEEHRDAVLHWFEQWQNGALSLPEAKVSWGGQRVPFSGPLADWRNIPVTFALIGVCLLVALLTSLGGNLKTIEWFTISPFEIVGSDIYYLPLTKVIEIGELWRLFTPAFIHFGLFHLVFNMMWLLDLGWYIERRHGHLFLLALVLITAAIGNMAEFVFSPNSLFIGGMSGAIYGLLGFCWQRQKVEPKNFPLPSGVYMFMMIWLLIGFSGVLEAFGFGRIANLAHAGGLIAGVVLGWFYNHVSVRRSTVK